MITVRSRDDLDHIFTYHAPKNDQPNRYEKIRNAGLELAKVIYDNTNIDMAESQMAINKIREAVMWANAGIACNE